MTKALLVSPVLVQPFLQILGRFIEGQALLFMGAIFTELGQVAEMNGQNGLKNRHP